MMKNIFKYLVVFVIYNILVAVPWYGQEVVIPMFVAVYILINVYLMDTKKNFLINFATLSGLMVICEIIAFCIPGVHKPSVYTYMLLMPIISLLVYYLKRNFASISAT